MNPAITLGLCFIPLAIIVIGMKFILLLEESGREIKHVKEESLKDHVYLTGVYDDVDKEDDDDTYS